MSSFKLTFFPRGSVTEMVTVAPFCAVAVGRIISFPTSPLPSNPLILIKSPLKTVSFV